jgi:serine protease Do
MIRKSFAFILFVLIGVGAGSAQDPKPDKPAPVTKGFSWSFDGDGGYLGVQTEEVTKDNFAKFGLREVKGVGVESVVDGSPAQAAGLQKGDVIVRVNGDEITSTRKLTRLIGEISPDHQARLTILRGGNEREVNVTLGKRPGFKFEEGAFAGVMPNMKWEFPKMPDMPDLSKLPKIEVNPFPPGTPDAPFAFSWGHRRQIGVGTTPLTKQLAGHFGVENGVLVNDVRENSAAAKAGIKAGDVITEVDGKPVKGDHDLVRAISEKKDGSVTLTVVRDRNRQTITVTPEEVKGGWDNHFELLTPDAPAAPGTFKLARPGVPAGPGVAPAPLTQMFFPGRII